MPETSICRKCPARIMWVKNAKTGNLMPLDAEPVPDGNVVINPNDGLAHVLGGNLFEGREVDSNLPKYKSHFATCPAAKEFRKKTPHKRGPQ